MKVKPEKEISSKSTSSKDSKSGGGAATTTTLTSNLADSSILNNKIETLINETISLYEKFDLVQIETATRATDSIQTKNDLFEDFMRSYRNLTSKITEMKTENYFHFKNTFQTTNLCVIKFYEFISKQLYKAIQINSDDEFKFCSYSVKLTIELIHVLISSTDEADEYSNVCCDQLVKKFNFTSSICNLLLSYSTRLDQEKSSNHKLNENGSRTLLQEEKHFRMTFNVLNKLTLDNKIFLFDCFVNDFTRYSINKLIGTCDKSVKYYYLQFISNLVRNNKYDLTELLNENKLCSLLCRSLSKLIKTVGNKELSINCLIILIRLCYEETSSSSFIVSKDINYQIDTALKIISNNQKVNSYDFTKDNAANFLISCFNMDNIIKHLEMKEDYASLILFKLNYILMDEKMNQDQICSNTSIKVFEILNTLASNSKILAEILFQIIFNTQKYLDKREEENKIVSLKKKFNDFILQTYGENNEDDSKYDAIIEFYNETAKFSLNLSLMLDLSKTLENGSFLIQNCEFHLKYLEYLIQLIKKNETFADVKSIEKKINSLFIMMCENFKSLYELFDSNLKNPNNELFDFNKENISKVYFYTLTIIDAILKLTKGKNMKQCEIFKNLIEMFKQTTANPCLISSENFFLTDENVLISSRVLIRFLNSNGQELITFHEALFKYFQEEYFLNLLSFAIIQNDRIELSALAYEILFELNNFSKNNDFKYNFNFELFLKQNQKFKNEKKTIHEDMIISNSHFSASATEFPIIDEKNELADLLEVYEYKLNEKKIQEAKMANLLNQYFAEISLAESEAKILRNKLKTISHREQEAQNGRKSMETKYDEMVKSNQIFKEKNAEIILINTKLSNEKRKLTEQLESLKKEFEQMEKDNQESIQNLQNALNTEKSGKKDLQLKLKEADLKVIEIEKSKKLIDSKKKELENKLITIETQLDETQSKLNETSTKLSDVETQHTTLKGEYDKLKSILSYVKDNYK